MSASTSEVFAKNPARRSRCATSVRVKSAIVVTVVTTCEESLSRSGDASAISGRRARPHWPRTRSGSDPRAAGGGHPATFSPIIGTLTLSVSVIV